MKQQRRIPDEIDIDGFFGRVTRDDSSGCWEWRTVSGRGYGVFKGFPAHRISWKIHKNTDPYGSYVLHKCDNRACVNPDHLYLGTQSDNMRDMWQRDRRRYNSGAARHGWEKIDQIRSAYMTGRYSLSELGRMFGMNRSLVFKIVNNTIWRR